LPFYGIRSYWQYLLSYDPGIRRFFNWRLHKLYYYINEIKQEEILDFYPTRTYNLNYNDENLILLDKLYGQELLDPCESKLYEISSGKISFREIIQLGKEKIFSELPEDEVYKKVLDFYIKMEKLCAVIFAKI